MKKTVVRITGFLLILLMVLAGINRVFKMKYGDGIYSLTKFYEHEEGQRGCAGFRQQPCV